MCAPLTFLLPCGTVLFLELSAGEMTVMAFDQMFHTGVLPCKGKGREEKHK